MRRTASGRKTDVTKNAVGVPGLSGEQVASYLARIGLSVATPTPCLPTLRALRRAHLRAVPFENLDIHLGRPITLNPAAIVCKIVDDRRGGICYELNGAFAALLPALGFENSRH